MIVASGAGVYTLWGGKEHEKENAVENVVQGGEIDDSRKEVDYSLPFAYVRGQNIHFVQTSSQSNSQSSSQSNVDTSQSNLPPARSSSILVPRPLLSGEYLISRSLKSPTCDSGENILTLVGGGTHEHLTSWNELTGRAMNGFRTTTTYLL